MLRQRVSARFGSRAGNSNVNLRLPSALRRIPGTLREALATGPLGRVRPGPIPWGESSFRRGAIAALSGVLLVGSLLLARPGGEAAYARGYIADSPQSMAAGGDSGWQDGGQPATRAGSSGTSASQTAPAGQGSAGPAQSQPAPQPSPTPDRATGSSRGGPRPTPDISTHDKFIAAVAEAARMSQEDVGVPASVTIAQAILESDWGQSLLATKAQNYFGIKASRGPGPAGVVNMNTWEVLSGANVTVNDAFKAYHNLDESVMDHGHFLADNSRYAAAFKVPGDPQEFARRIHAAGYATDPAYSAKLINLMTKFNLYQYDLPQPGKQ